MKKITLVSFTQVRLQHLRCIAHRGQSIFPVGTWNQNSIRQFVVNRNSASPNNLSYEILKKYPEVRIETIQPNQSVELSHWSAMFDNNTPVLIKGMSLHDSSTSVISN